MGIAKKIKSETIFIFLFLVIFPFGQITRMSISLLGLDIPLLPLDFVVGLGSFYTLFFQEKKSVVVKFFSFILFTFAFTYILSIFVLGKEAFYGFFYLLRLFFYLIFFNYVQNFVIKNESKRELLLQSLLAVSVISAFFGWIQYLAWPDLRPLFYIGWDDHLYRLAGTFLDPTFLGLIIVFGLMLSINQFIDKGNKKHLFLIIFLLISLAFTYSRASYLAFVFGILVLSFLKRRVGKILLTVLVLMVMIFFLPTDKNQNIKLTRTFSIEARLQNYKETLLIFKKHPLFGVGYNNICVSRNTYIKEEPFSSHACSGSDSSFLLILAAGGLTGLFVFIGQLFPLFKKVKEGYKSHIMTTVSAALFIHSFFSNSLFYPWIIGYLVILLAVTVKE